MGINWLGEKQAYEDYMWAVGHKGWKVRNEYWSNIHTTENNWIHSYDLRLFQMLSRNSRVKCGTTWTHFKLRHNWMRYRVYPARKFINTKWWLQEVGPRQPQNWDWEPDTTDIVVYAQPEAFKFHVKRKKWLSQLGRYILRYTSLPKQYTDMPPWKFIGK